jgi:MoaA/NifB/PqqE/SkfB family radical SAM enzyme
MRRITQNWASGHLLNMVSNVNRRRSWFLEGASPGQLANLALAGAEFGLGRQRMRALPVLIKVDISPACNLGCTFCVHAEPAASATPSLLAGQDFKRKLMPLDRFTQLVEEVRGRTSAVSLYYLGDPLMHPQLPEICSVAASAGLAVHVSSNFSFRLSDERLLELATSGLTHLTVCVDSLRQDRFELTRVGGRIDLVLDNLERILAIRRRLGLRRPKIEVQFIVFQHNLDERDDAASWCADHGVDQFTAYWGNLHNYGDLAPSQVTVHGPLRARPLPRCSWPHFSMQVKYDGDTIPCCYHRQSEQYRPGGDARPVGNVFSTSIREVWNSPRYQLLRRISRNPAAAEQDGASSSFCHGCPVVYETDAAAHELVADRHSWDDVYARGDDGKVYRR